DNYKRDADGNPVYFEYTGGGTTETAQYKVRVLYYNFYTYRNGFEPEYIFGTDSQGYDLALRLAGGIRLSILVAICVSAINLTLGALYGAVEGYYGGAADILMERLSDILAGIPFIVAATLFQIHLSAKVGAVPSLLFAFILTGWIGTASRVRTQFYRFKGQEYVTAARTLGARDGRIIWKHIFPNSLGTIITASVLVIPGVISSESMLSYLGIVKLGGTDVTSLGTLMSDASSLWINYPHLMVFPALIISLLMICFNLFGNGLRDAFNPSLRGVEE
ncbi:MAG: ABC transporter permease, partial [Clostridia bacterium]|nr:ABC transporter permease [Clostridia bacterium]